MELLRLWWRVITAPATFILCSWPRRCVLVHASKELQRVQIASEEAVVKVVLAEAIADAEAADEDVQVRIRQTHVSERERAGEGRIWTSHVKVGGPLLRGDLHEDVPMFPHPEQ